MSQKPRSIFGLISVFILVLALVTNAQDSATQKEPAGPKKLGEQKSPSNDAPPTVKIPSFEETKPVPEFVDLFNGKDLRRKKGSGDKSYNLLFNIPPFFAPWHGQLHFLCQFAHIRGAAHVKGLRDPFLRHAGLFRDDMCE